MFSREIGCHGFCQGSCTIFVRDSTAQELVESVKFRQNVSLTLGSVQNIRGMIECPTNPCTHVHDQLQ